MSTENLETPREISTVQTLWDQNKRLVFGFTVENYVSGAFMGVAVDEALRGNWLLAAGAVTGAALVSFLSKDFTRIIKKNLSRYAAPTDG